MQRQLRKIRGSATGYNRYGATLWHSEGEQQVHVPLHREPAVFKAFTGALRTEESVLSIAERFDTDHCTVLYWRRQLGLDRQPDVESWPACDDKEADHDLG